MANKTDIKSTNPSDIKILMTHQDGTHRLLKTTVPVEIVDNLQNILEQLIEQKGLTGENLMYIVTNLMSAVGKYKKLTGMEKKEIVLILVNRAIDESAMDPQVKASLKLAIESVIPNAIDVLVLVAKGKYKFKYIPKLVDWLKKCRCNCC